MAEYIDKDELSAIKDDLGTAFSELMNYIESIPTSDPSALAPVNIETLRRLANNVAKQATHIAKLNKR